MDNTFVGNGLLSLSGHDPPSTSLTRASLAMTIVITNAMQAMFAQSLAAERLTQ